MIEIQKLTGNNKLFKVIFSYQPLTAGKHKIFLTGDFNEFSPDKNKFIEDNGIYYCHLELPKGKYSYKFIVDGNWIPDINAEEITADGYGGHNSVLYVGDPAQINTYRLVVFNYPDNGDTKSVYIAGSFNNWQEKSDKLIKNEQGQFEIIIPLPPGKYSYRFIVDGHWLIDPKSDLTELNSYREYDSIIYVDEKYPELNESSLQQVITFGIPSRDLQNYCSASTDKIRFKTFSYKQKNLHVSLLLSGQKMPLELIGSNHCCAYYQQEIPTISEEISFLFLYETNAEQLYLGQNGFRKDQAEVVPFQFNPKNFMPFSTPLWVKEGIIYQIFTDRFYNGNPALNQDFSEWYYKGLTNRPLPGRKLPPHIPCYNFVEDWYDHSGLLQSPFHEDGIPDHFSFYGGDLEGIRQKLDYLTDLGVTILYLNPVFEARSNHKYDCSDYRKVDPHFGSETDFKNLVKSCHAKDIRLIIDVAFNHTGDTFWAFRDALQKGPASSFYNWYEWKKWPLPSEKNYIPSEYYSCWWGLGHMPDLDYDKSRFSPAENPVKNIEDAEPNWEVVNYILDTAEFWLNEMDIDGFRLDVPNEVPFWFWELFRKKVKSVKPDAYIVGEIWHNASEWIGNKYFDAVMNYSCFKDPVIQFFNLRKGNALDFDEALKPGLLNYPEESTRVMMNLLDSHDTFRYLEIARGDLVRFRLALIFQMTYIGAPHIWYGDEIAMQGAHDPDCRRPFNWRFVDDPDKVAFRDFYKKLINIRKSHPALIHGDFKTISASGMTYSYLRKTTSQHILIALNNDADPQNLSLEIGFNGNFTDLLTGRKYLTHDEILNIKLNSFSGAILLKEEDGNSEESPDR